jgi:hypothetical protein
MAANIECKNVARDSYCPVLNNDTNANYTSHEFNAQE